jgi:UDP-2-acetamido-3-amino-2,3-dideoxy-glucuronate N-acetyltransferase
MDYFKHETAIVDAGAKIGRNSKVWHWAHICGGAQIGDGCVFGQNVFVGNRCILGNNVKIQNNVSIYDNVNLEDDVFCGPSMVFTNVINPRSQFVRKDEYLETTVKRGSTIGANATIVCGVTLGEYCFVAAGAVVTKNVAPFALVAGVPAKQIGWMSRFGERVELPMVGSGKWTCPNTKETYLLDGTHLSLVKKD